MGRPSERTPSFLDAAEVVLNQAGYPLSPSEIVTIASQQGYISSKGRTPSQSMKARLSEDVLELKEESRFMRTEKNTFGLRRWKGRFAEFIADRYQKALLEEEIVVFERKILEKFIPGPGLHRLTDLESTELIANTFPMQRQEAEEDFSVVQLVSAFLVECEGRYATYRRTARLPEKRLHGVHSLLFGGHLNPDDVAPLFSVFDPTLGPTYISRELSEELRFSALPKLTLVGAIYDDRREVSLQHLGVLYDVSVPVDCEVEIGERGFLQHLRFETPQGIASHLQDFENWSELVLTQHISTV